MSSYPYAVPCLTVVWTYQSQAYDPGEVVLQIIACHVRMHTYRTIAHFDIGSCLLQHIAQCRF